MILLALNQLYDRLEADPCYEIPPNGFSRQKIGFRVVLKPDGTLFELQDARTLDAKGKLQSVHMLVLGAEKQPGLGLNPCFLWDNATYMLGHHPAGKPARYGQDRFEEFRRIHLKFETEINDPQFSCVCRFLEHWNPSQLVEFSILSRLATSFGVFQLQGAQHPVHTSQNIRDWWVTRHSESEPSRIIGQCMVTGSRASLARIHPKIRGIPGAQSSGASLVSCNQSAYESYGKLQSFNAPVSEPTAHRYGIVLNALLGGPLSEKHRIRIGDTTTIFWTEKPSLIEDCLTDILSLGSQANQVQDPLKREKNIQLLEAISSGSHLQNFAGINTPLHLLGISPNAARLSIRFYLRSTAEEILESLHDHHACLSMDRQIIDVPGKRSADPEFPTIKQILCETAHTPEDTSALLGGALIRSILEGEAYPEGLFSTLIMRIRADRKINYLRSATLKAILIRNHNQPITVMLDSKSTHPAYLSGRLFASLERIQEDARWYASSSLRDLYYRSASTTPASVFPRLLHTSQHLLTKLSAATRVARERLMQEILAKIPSEGFAEQFALKDQGIFAIGYYHQRRDFFKSHEINDSIESITCKLH